MKSRLSLIHIYAVFNPNRAFDAFSGGAALGGLFSAADLGLRDLSQMCIRDSQYKLHGILNGIDTDIYNPETDKAIAKNFSAKDPAGKKEDKADLQRDVYKRQASRNLTPTSISSSRRTAAS